MSREVGGNAVLRQQPAHRIALARVLGIVLASATAIVLMTAFAVGAGRSKEASACGGQKNQIQAEFDIPRAQDVWTVFPAMLRAPELEEDASPAHVVVFRGEFDLNGMVAIQAEDQVPTLQGVICVVQSDGAVNLYDSVSMAGAKIP